MSEPLASPSPLAALAPLTPLAPRVDLAPYLERAFAEEPREESYEIDLGTVEGDLPAMPDGAFVANGPARFRQGDLAYRHWLDGDGMVWSVRFAGGRISFTSRFVATAKAREEAQAGRALYRAFGTAFAGDRLVRGVALASPANVSAVPWRGQLLASGEQGLPIALDPRTLESRGEFTFDGKLNPLSPLSAHPKLDPARGEMIHFGVSYAGAQPSITVYRFGEDGELRLRRRVAIDRAAVLHDFAVSPRHLVFYLSPYVAEVGGLLARGASLQDCLAWRPELGSRLLVLSRETGDEVASIPVPTAYCLHLANAWERPRREHASASVPTTEHGSARIPNPERLVVDLLELDGPAYDEYHPVPDLFATAPAGRPVRLQVELGGASGGRFIEREVYPYEAAPDFPQLDPRRQGEATRDVWMLGLSTTGERGRKFFDEVARVDFGRDRVPSGEAARPDVWRAPLRVYPGSEPAMVPIGDNPREGAVLVPLLDGEHRTTSLAVFDAFAIERGPRARIPLRSPMHLSFHASWVEAEESGGG